MHRLVLFDIDETMIHSSGVGRRALERALSQVFAQPISFNGHSLSGKTDPQIIGEVLSDHGIDAEQLHKLLPKIFDVYVEYLQQEVIRAQIHRVHDGVLSLLDALGSQSDIYLGLLTGNIERGARIKLEPLGLNKFFDFGAFGCDAANRMDLPAIAHRRAADRFKIEFEKRHIVIIGDARNDVLCAKGYGARAVAVCTGGTTRETLAELQPDHLFDNLSDTAAVMDAILRE